MSTEQTNQETIPSMDDFKDDIEKSFKKLKVGDLVTGTIIDISETGVTLDLESYAEGIINVNELSNDPSFSLNDDLVLNDSITTIVVKEDDGNGNILLSKKQADDIVAWDKLVELNNNQTIVEVKISQAVKAGVIAYLQGIRGFIPASQLSVSYVENLEEWVGKTIEATVITASSDERRLILSGKEVELKKQLADQDSKMANLQIGIIVKGLVETIVPYGAFVKLENGLTGLVHISQIANKRINSPNEIIKEGEEVNVKILAIKDGKISLSIKGAQSNEYVVDDLRELKSSYNSGGDVTTDLSSLLKDIKL
ncbi:MAG TPA: S1 RNA-binding domain-containing protein [Clostridiales bacterium]|nr:S1 RNA-binding domain-containing protein [Clostridiales bacterium]